MNESNTISIIAICIAGLSFLVSVASCVFAYFQTQRAKEANKIAQDANRIAERKLGHTELKDLRDQYHAAVKRATEHMRIPEIHPPSGDAGPGK